jgi:penicillin amidase
LKASEIQVIEELSFWDSAKMSGSNNWILAPSRTKSGSAMLANDPHLALKYPAFWFWQVFKSNNGVVIGSSLPGVPIIANGFNGKVAWGLTNAYINAAELFLIKKETVKDIKSRYPLIWIKKWGIKLPMFFKKYHESKSTGLLFPPLENENRDYDTALTWSGFYLNNSEIEPIFDVKNLNSSKEASHLFSKIALPSWNFVFADKAGDIGYQVAGAQWEASNKLGLIEKADLIELQNRKKNLKKGLSLPGIFNPVRGYLVTANNQHSYSNKKYGRAHAQDFRAHQIEKELLEQPKHDNESVSKIQCQGS